MSRIAVLGSGEVGKVLARGLTKHGHDVRIASRSAEKLADFCNDTGIPNSPLAEAAAWAEGAVLAVRGDGAPDAVRLAGPENLKGKWVLDTTNPIAKEAPEEGVLRFFTGPNDSLMERLQAAWPDIRFVKAFNSVGSAWMVNPAFPPGSPGTMFYCGNDAGAKEAVAEIIRAFGWEGWDMGGAKSARALEPLCQLWCLPGFLENRWNQAFRLMPL